MFHISIWRGLELGLGEQAHQSQPVATGLDRGLVSNYTCSYSALKHIHWLLSSLILVCGGGSLCLEFFKHLL